MLLEEARWIADAVTALDLLAGAVVVDVGSSTEEFRRLEQPYIDYYIYLPLRRARVSIAHVDAKDAPGVDVVADITSESPPVRGDLVICSNLLEHVTDRDAVAVRLSALINPGGHLIVTVPRRYPHHPDPIDTMFRPSPQDLVELFARHGLEANRAEELEVTANFVTASSLLHYATAKLASVVRVRRLNPSMYGRATVTAAVFKKPS